MSSHSKHNEIKKPYIHVSLVIFCSVNIYETRPMIAFSLTGYCLQLPAHTHNKQNSQTATVKNTFPTFFYFRTSVYLKRFQRPYRITIRCLSSCKSRTGGKWRHKYRQVNDDFSRWHRRVSSFTSCGNIKRRLVLRRTVWGKVFAMQEMIYHTTDDGVAHCTQFIGVKPITVGRQVVTSDWLPQTSPDVLSRDP